MIYLSLGSNRGNRLSFLQQAVDLLKKRCLKNMTWSIILETECILPDGAPSEWNKPFLNMVVAGVSDLSPFFLLRELKQIEQELGRPEHYERWSPRVIDLDILLWDDLVLNNPSLTIPHPELDRRPFLGHLLTMMGVERKSHIPANCFLRSFTLFPRFVGIVNITPDSFSDGGLYNTADKAIKQALNLAANGASIIEIGAQSTRPGSVLQTPDEEYGKLEPVLDGLKNFMEKEEITVSVDTFWPEVIQKILSRYSVKWINDVRGSLDDRTLQYIARKNCHFVAMHSLGIPPQKDRLLPNDPSPVSSLIEWAQKMIGRLLSCGFEKSSIIIDPGIGFGKSAYQNIHILRTLIRLKSMDIKILIGHSRKSFIEAFSLEEAKMRDIETIAISDFLKNKVDFLRVHNVADHRRFFVAQQAIVNIG
ncbi:dihydropteroate synthase [Caedimonas varicaedens]|uniref:Dihydropteroate synthase n=1 Tax=Caedimonas varicaedens TaxID=1629334 RepID=A0A0K8MAX0_9PROT|nr:dihydropteroate synthase [Caedimonas varicaedens]